MKLTAVVGGREIEVSVEAADGDGSRFRVRGLPGAEPADGEVLIDAVVTASGLVLREQRGGALVIHDLDLETGKEGETIVHVAGTPVPVKLLDARALAQREAQARVAASRPGHASALAVKAPMPGRVVKVLVKDGEQVAAGQGLVVVEAMKMENELRAPRAGTVRGIRVAEGQAVEGQEDLLSLDA